MGADPTKFGVGQYDSFHALTLTSQLVNDPTKGPAYNAPPKKENQNVFFSLKQISQLIDMDH